MSDLIGPGSTIGILGAGQLGRMLALAARQMGYRVAVFGGDRSSPAGQVCDLCWPGHYDDTEQLAEFASACDVVTYEFENVPAQAAKEIAGSVPLRPGVALLTAAQNRFAEKTALAAAGLQTAEFRMVASAAELSQARDDFGGAVILKSNTDGYDGKGQWSIAAGTNLEELWASTGLNEAIVEQRIDFAFELSVIGGRFESGDVRLFDPFLNHHANHILDVTVSGSPLISSEISAQATEMAARVLEHFEVVGVLCVELFLTQDGRLIVNEIAPRPHNSGHLTIEAYSCSQFELQLRTICGWPPAALIRRNSVAAMANLLGQHLPPNWSSTCFHQMSAAQCHVHLYGKGQLRTDRKVGHLTAMGDNAASVETAVRAARRGLKLQS